MLEMKGECERCEKAVAKDGVAYICSFECTFCESCSAEMEFICPNCTGRLVVRPERSTLHQAIADGDSTGT